MMTAKEKILRSCDIPAVPMVAMKILRLVDSPSTDLSDLQEVIMADQALAARVLRMANSAYYGLRREIDTVSDAILVMGFATIKNLALAVSTRDAYRKFGLLEQKMWEHSIGVSVAAGLIANLVRLPRPEEAVMAGLLHDVGKVVMNNTFPEKFLEMTEKVYEGQVTYVEIEEEMFGFGHAEAGGMFAKKWEFPSVLCKVIVHHHAFEPGAEPVPHDGDEILLQLCKIIAFADSLALKLGVGYREPKAGAELRCIEDFGISEETLAELEEQFKLAYINEKMMYQS